MDDNSACCSVCVGALPCLFGVSKFSAGPACCGGAGRCGGPAVRTNTHKVRVPKWRKEEEQWVKTNLQTFRGVTLTDSTMSTMEV